ncbi:MAG: ATP-binding cassette domain-containing protein [Clostridiales bacterium]|nr:ATP-binding cassette domain-containing protein [Clostridiales bacterium]
MNYRIQNLTYQYTPDGNEVLRDISLEIRQSTVTAVVGPSGCGKTTLVNILSGVIPKLESNGVLQGELELGENPLVSVVSQSPENQLFGYGVEDAIAFGMENMGLPAQEISERMEYVLDLLNLQYLRKRSVAALSGGQRQAVCIASVLAMRPNILIMDEPVSSLDPNGKKMVQGVLNQLRADGTTVLIVDNNLEWSAGIVDRVVGLSDGQVLFDGEKEEFFRNFDLQEKLGVTIPQEAEIYRAMAKIRPEIPMFYSMQGAVQQLDALFAQKELAAAPAAEELPEEAFLTAHQLNKVFADGFHALKDINTSFPKGQVVAIMGQNGSGKTTLVKHLNGLHKPTSGDVRYNGQSTLKKTVAQISKNIILVFQHPEHMLFEQTVTEEITFCARMQGLPFTDEQVAEVLEKYGLTADAETFPINLSMGKKHLLTILSVLFSSADVVILDEPTLGMDLHIKTQLEEIISFLKEQGKTVIMISHEIPLVFKVADSAVILSGGKKIYEGGKEALARRDDIFDSINISLPPVVQLSRRYGFGKVCYNVAEFAEQAAAMLEQKEA